MPTSSDLASTDALMVALGDAAQTAAAGAADNVDGVTAGVVVFAGHADQVAAVLEVAARHQATVVARGRGTKMDWGAPPTTADVLVDVSGMDRIVDHAAGDLVVRVQPGVTLAGLRDALAPAGQRLAVDEVMPGSTVGGVIATGLAGPGRLLHGSVRDLLLGVTVALADGRRATSGGQVVKNVAGYDLAKLYTGAFGTLGIVTEAILRLHPVPERRMWVTTTAIDRRALEVTASAVLRSPVAPGAFELHRFARDALSLAVLMEGTARGVGERATTLATLLGPGATSADAPPPWWGHLPGTGEGETLLKLTMAPAGVGAVVEAVAHDGVTVGGSAGAGVLWAGIGAETDPSVTASTVADARRACAEAGGSALMLRTSGPVRALVDAWGPVPALALMRRVKNGFDPDHRLAPGRFVGGI